MICIGIIFINAYGEEHTAEFIGGLGSRYLDLYCTLLLSVCRGRIVV